jgi:hypothetical protein
MTWNNCLIDGVPTFKCLEVVFQNLFTAIGGLIFLILLVMFILGSVQWLTAGADPSKLKKAQGTFFTAILGLIIIASSYLILIILKNVFGIEVTVFRMPDTY